MQYMQQKTPFIQRWEKAMEEMLTKETEGQKPPQPPAHGVHPGLPPQPPMGHSMSHPQLQQYGSSYSSPPDLGQFQNEPLKSQLSKQADMQKFSSYTEEIGAPRKEKEKEKEEKEKEKEKDRENEKDKEKLLGEIENGREVRDEGEKTKPKKRKKDAEDEEDSRKEIHNATEKKRREKINTKLEELKNLIPHCKNTNAQKAAVLGQAVDYIKTLVSSYNEQVELNRKLQENANVLNNELKELHQSLWQRDRVFLSNLQQYRGF